jgi:hypothetical protein
MAILQTNDAMRTLVQTSLVQTIPAAQSFLYCFDVTRFHQKLEIIITTKVSKEDFYLVDMGLNTHSLLKQPWVIMLFCIDYDCKKFYWYKPLNMIKKNNFWKMKFIQKCKILKFSLKVWIKISKIFNGTDRCCQAINGLCYKTLAW